MTLSVMCYLSTTPSNVFPPRNTPNNMIYSPRGAYSMPPRHLYPPSDDYSYSQYNHQQSIGYSHQTIMSFHHPLTVTPVNQAATICFLPPSSSHTNSGTCHVLDVIHNTYEPQVMPPLDSQEEDTPVFTLLQSTYSCYN